MGTPETVVLRFHTIEHEEGRRCAVAEALDAKTGLPVVAMSLPMLAAWLGRRGYRWRPGSNGIWDRRPA